MPKKISEKTKATLVVSDEFIDIYMNLIVNDQTSKIQLLSEEEQFLLFLLGIESYEESEAFLDSNLSPFIEKVSILNDYLSLNKSEGYLRDTQDEKFSTLQKLSDLTRDSEIDLSTLRDSKGNSLPKAPSSEEARIKRREVGINNILD